MNAARAAISWSAGQDACLARLRARVPPGAHALALVMQALELAP